MWFELLCISPYHFLPTQFTDLEWLISNESFLRLFPALKLICSLQYAKSLILANLKIEVVFLVKCAQV